MTRFSLAARGKSIPVDEVKGYRYVIAVDGIAVIQTRSNGQAFPMGYRSERHAHARCLDVRAAGFPTAVVIDKQAKQELPA